MESTNENSSKSKPQFVCRSTGFAFAKWQIHLVLDLPILDYAKTKKQIRIIYIQKEVKYNYR